MPGDLLDLLIGCGCRKRCCCGQGEQTPAPAAARNNLFQAQPRTRRPPQVEEETPFVPPRPLDLAPLLLPGAGLVVGVGVGAPTSLARATGGYAGPFAGDGSEAAYAALQSLGLPYPVRPSNRTTEPLHLYPEVVASTLSGGQLQVLYAATWGGTRENGEAAGTGGPMVYVLVGVDPIAGTEAVQAVHRVPRPVGEEYTPEGPGDRGPEYAPNLAQQILMAAGQRHVAISTRPGEIRVLASLLYVDRRDPDPANRPSWRGMVELRVADGITSRLTEIPFAEGRSEETWERPPSEQYLHLGATGELPDGRLAWTVSGVSTQAHTAGGCDLVTLGDGVIEHLAAFGPEETAVLLGQFEGTSQEGQFRVREAGASARHNQRIGSTHLEVNTAQGVRTVFFAGGVGGSSLSRVYPGWTDLTGSGYSTVRRVTPGPLTVARRARIEVLPGAPVYTRLRVPVTGGGAALRSGDRLSVRGLDLPVGGASERMIEVLTLTSLTLEAGDVLTPTPYADVLWGGHLAPAQLPQPEPEWLPTQKLLPATNATPPGSEPVAERWRQVRPLPPRDPDVPHPDLKRAALRGRAGEALRLTWPGGAADPLAAYVLTLIARLPRPGTLVVEADAARWEYPGGPGVLGLSLPGRRWVQLRSLALHPLSGPPATTLTADQPIEISSVLIERMR